MKSIAEIMNFIPFGMTGVPYPFPIMPSMGWGWAAAPGQGEETAGGGGRGGGRKPAGKHGKAMKANETNKAKKKRPTSTTEEKLAKAELVVANLKLQLKWVRWLSVQIYKNVLCRKEKEAANLKDAAQGLGNMEVEKKDEEKEKNKTS